MEAGYFDKQYYMLKSLIIYIILSFFPVQIFSVAPVYAQPYLHDRCEDIQVSNIRSNYASISWISALQTTSKVYYDKSADSLSQISFDKRGEGTISYTHFHPLINLESNTTYFYKIIQNDTSCFEGSFQTAPSLSLPGLTYIYGMISYPDSAPFEEGAIVYIRVKNINGTSSLLATLTTQQGGWSINLVPLTEDLSSYFVFTNNDTLSIEVKYWQPCFDKLHETTVSQGIPPNIINFNVDECTGSLCYSDVDGDQYGDPNNYVFSVFSCPFGYVKNADDYDDSDPNIPGDKRNINFDLPGGWSMISLPLLPDNASVASLFPGVVVVYCYKRGAGYVRIKGNEVLEKGKGYWILFNNDQNLVITGQPIHSYTHSVHENGWEMIGGCSNLAKASGENCNIVVIYRYALGTGYQRVTASQNLQPGQGYWILFNDVIDQANLNVISIELPQGAR